MAFGLNSPYWKDNPLKMYAGETKYVEFNLENSVSEQENAKAAVSIIGSGGIAQIIGPTEFNIPPGSKDNKIIIKISIPKDTEIGKTYNVRFSVRALNPQEQGIVQINVGYDSEFPVIVVEKSEASTTDSNNKLSIANMVVIVVVPILIITIIVLYFVYRKKSNLNN